MIYTQEFTLLGRSVLVILSEAWPMEGTYTFPVTVLDGLTGIERRQAERQAPLLSMTFSAEMADAEYQQFRTALMLSPGRLVGVPVWYDYHPAAEWANRAHQAQVNIGWNWDPVEHIYSGVNITTDGSQPTGAFCAPLLIGGIKGYNGESLTGTAGAVRFTVYEKGPWDFRVAVPAAADPAAWSWEPDLSEPADETVRWWSEDLDMGGTRDIAQEGEPIATLSQRLHMQFDFSEFREFFAFWRARGGRSLAFSAPSILQPGTPTDQAPHEFDGEEGRGLMRFGGDSFTVKWEAPDVALSTINLSQVITTLESQVEPASAWLFKIVRRDRPANPLYVTDWEAPITAMGHTWTPAHIMGDNLTRSLKPNAEPGRISVWLPHAQILQDITRGALEEPVNVTVYECQLSGTITHWLYSGIMIKPEIRGEVLEFRVSAWGGKLKRQFPTLHRTRHCSWHLFDPQCTKRKPSHMVRSKWEASGKIVEQWKEPKLIINNLDLPDAFIDYITEGKLSGRVIGTNTTWRNMQDRTRDKAFDGSTSTFFDPGHRGAWTGLDMGWPFQLSKIRWYPRATYEHRMVGGKFQGSNHPDFGDAVDLHVIGSTPSLAWHEVEVSGEWRCVRYINSSNHADVSEIEIIAQRDGWHYFDNGVVVHEPSGVRRAIAWSAYLPGDGQMHLALNDPFPEHLFEPGDDVTFWPGCDGTARTCKFIFDNYETQGGNPHQPEYIEQAVPPARPTGK